MKIGIIGYGSFGMFAAKALSPHAEISIYDRNNPAVSVPLDAFSNMDAIILAVPLSSYETVIEKLKPVLNSQTLIVDICSVKVPSRDTVLKLLSSHEHILISHPLFGPQSAANGLRGHDIVVTDTIGPKAIKSINFMKDILGLNVHIMTAEDHDKMMAYIHALTFFVARGLSGLKIPNVSLQTPSFSMLQALIDLDSNHSDDLFLTIQKGNPFAKDVRREFINELDRLDKEVN